MSDPDTPIVVNPDPVPTQIWVAIRSLLQVAGGALVVKPGWLTEADLQIILGAFLILGPAIWSQVKARRNVAKLAVLADAAPNRIARVKS